MGESSVQVAKYTTIAPTRHPVTKAALGMLIIGNGVDVDCEMFISPRGVRLGKFLFVFSPFSFNELN
jgi:hypothetical protein